MSRSSLFSFSDQLDGYIIGNGKTVSAKRVPATMLAAIDQGRLRNIKSVSIAPCGGWIICYHEDAQGGPDGDNYFGEMVPKPLEQYLEAHAYEDFTNPLHYVKMGPEDQWFARRNDTMDWQLTHPVETSMKKLQRLGIQSSLEEVVFGLDHTAIFIFTNGSFAWDLPVDSEEHRILQENFAMGTCLEAAALSLATPGQYYFFWGQSTATYHIPKSEHASINDMVQNSVATRMQLRMAQTLMLESTVQNRRAQLQASGISMRASTADLADRQASVSCDDGFNSRGQVKDRTCVAKILQQFHEEVQPGPRQGNGNLRTWNAEC